MAMAGGWRPDRLLPKALRAISLARSPMAWKPSWKPAMARSAAIWLSLSCCSGGGRSCRASSE